MYEITTSIINFIDKAKTVYLKLSPEVPDFTVGQQFALSLHLPSKKLEIIVSPTNILEICAAIQQFVFNKGNFVIAWNIKELFTYCKFYTKTAIPFECVILDLKLIENFLGISKEPPENFASAINRAEVVRQKPSWKELYLKVYTPLFKDVIPSIETTPLLNIKIGKSVYSHYEIAGQANGRSLCSSVYKMAYNPHTMGIDVKSCLRPAGYDKVFVYCDYRQMEVSVLQWLSKDLVLKSLIRKGKDFYKLLHHILFGSVCDAPEKRRRCKEIFLPVVYGQSAFSLSKKLKISETDADVIIQRLKKLFPVAFSWIEQATGIDYFGKTRDFSDAPYKARNFAVQSPASIFCLEKLIDLHTALAGTQSQIAYHVHDGYGIICEKNIFKDISGIALAALSGYSKLLPELSIEAVAQVGTRLDNMYFMKDKND